MNKQLPVGFVVALLVVVVGLVAYWGFKTIGGPANQGPSQTKLDANAIMQKHKGDLSNLTPEEQKVINEARKQGMFSGGGGPPAGGPTGSALPPKANKESAPSAN